MSRVIIPTAEQVKAIFRENMTPVLTAAETLDPAEYRPVLAELSPELTSPPFPGYAFTAVSDRLALFHLTEMVRIDRHRDSQTTDVAKSIQELGRDVLFHFNHWHPSGS